MKKLFLLTLLSFLLISCWSLNQWDEEMITSDDVIITDKNQEDSFVNGWMEKETEFSFSKEEEKEIIIAYFEYLNNWAEVTIDTDKYSLLVEKTDWYLLKWSLVHQTIANFTDSYFLAANVKDSWIVLYIWENFPSCDLVDNFWFTSSYVTECYDSENKTLKMVWVKESDNSEQVKDSDVIKDKSDEINTIENSVEEVDKSSSSKETNIKFSVSNNNNTYTIYWEGVPKSTKEIKVLSCKQNFSSEYDTSRYILKKFKAGDFSFKYFVSEAYNNFCTTPYIIRFVSNDGEYFDEEISLK